MKKNLMVLTLISLMLVPGSQVFAHPPADITLQFDPETQTLSAVIIHPVNNPKSHYIKRVDIGLNGKEIDDRKYQVQENGREQSLTVTLPEAKAGDTLSVEGYCNLSGKLKKEIKIS
ncbi:MAG: hypothetical protein KTQ49_07105 [Candidatus Omnitrophica bacterium]|nr:hypothetical protein [Candidatus Omnitrophota bacterium]